MEQKHLTAKRLHSSGATISEIAAQLGISVATAKVRIAYVPRGGSRGRPKGGDIARKARAREMAAEGLTYREIGAELGGVSRQAAWMLVNQ